MRNRIFITAFSGSYPERLKNAAQSELPVGCHGNEKSIMPITASSGSYPERLKNAAQSELPVGCHGNNIRI
jgi:hypothetical protein